MCENKTGNKKGDFMVISYKLSIILFTLLIGVSTFNMVGAESSFSTNQNGQELIELLINNEPLQAIKEMIDAGVDVTYSDSPGGWTALLQAIYHPNALEIVPLLLAQGSDVNQADGVGVTPLEYALGVLKYGETELAKKLVKMLLSAGAKPDLIYYELTPEQKNVLDQSVASLHLPGLQEALLAETKLPQDVIGVIGDIAYGPKK
jgi:hypothetical protein